MFLFLELRKQTTAGVQSDVWKPRSGFPGYGIGPGRS